MRLFLKLSQHYRKTKGNRKIKLRLETFAEIFEFFLEKLTLVVNGNKTVLIVSYGLQFWFHIKLNST